MNLFDGQDRKLMWLCIGIAVLFLVSFLRRIIS